METYPHECCGALLGNDGEAGREIVDLVPLANRRNDSPRNRFEVTPEDVQMAEKKAKDLKLEVIGWYHSHPDAPARPSEFDREHAWPWYSYIIVSVQQREPRDTKSWRLRDDRVGVRSRKRLNPWPNLQASNWNNRGDHRMAVKVIIPTPLRPYTGKKESVELQAATVGEALSSLTTLFADLKKHLYSDDGKLRSFVNVYVNDEDIRYLRGDQTPLREGDILSIVPSIAGGTQN